MYLIRCTKMSQKQQSQVLDSLLIGLLVISIASEIGKSEAVSRRERSKDDFVRVDVPSFVREGSTAILRCLHDVHNDNLYSLKWYKGSQEFFRFTPKESPSIKTFPTFGGHVDMSLSNFSNVGLVEVNLNMTDKYTCEVTKDFPDYTTSMKTGKMTVVALPKHKPIIMTEQNSISVGDLFTANCTSYRSKPIADITWLLNGFLVGPHYLTSAVIVQDYDNKESITVGLNFTVRQQHFIRGRMTITCRAIIDPNLYSASAEMFVMEQDHSPRSFNVVSTQSSAGKGGDISPDSRYISISGSASFISNPIELMVLLIVVLVFKPATL